MSKVPPTIDVLPLAPLQEGMLFHSLYEPESTAMYLTQTAVTLVGSLDEARLYEAATEVLARHANLRASFRFRKSGEPVQLVRREAEPVWQRVELEDVGTVAKAIEQDWQRGIDLAADSLLRFTLLRESETRH